MGIYHNLSCFKSKKQLDSNEIAIAVESANSCRKLSEFASIGYGRIDNMISVAVGFIIKHSRKGKCVYVGYNYDWYTDNKNYIEAESAFVDKKTESKYTRLYENALYGDLYIVCEDTKEYINYTDYFRKFFRKSRALDIAGCIFNQCTFNKMGSDEKLSNWYRKAVYATNDIADICDGYTDVTADFY